MNEAEQKLLDYATKQLLKEKDKFMSGMKSNLYQWEDLLENLNKWLKVSDKN